MIATRRPSGIRRWVWSVAAGILCAFAQCGLAAPPVAYRELPAVAPRVVRLTSEPAILRQRAAPILSLVYSREGRGVTTVDGVGQIATWDLARPGQRQLVADLNGEWACAALSHDGRWLAYADQDGAVSILELASKKHRLQTGARAARTVAIAFSDDGRQLATVTEAGDVQLWDVPRGEAIRSYSTTAGAVQTAAFSHDGTQLVIGSFTRELRRFNVATPDKPSIIDVGNSRVTATAFAPDDRRLVVATADGATRVHFLVDEMPPVALDRHTFAVWRLAFDAGGQRLAAASWDGTVRVWETASWGLSQSHKSNEQSFSAMSFGPDGDFVAASLDGWLLHWPVAPPVRQAAAIIDGRADSVWVGVYSPDGKLLFVGGRERRFELWDLTTYELRVSRHGHPTTRCAVFSPDGRTLVTGGDDGVVSMCDAQTGEVKHMLPRHPGAVSAVVFNSKGDLLVSACDGGVVKLWDPHKATEKATWREHERQIYGASISLDDKWLLTGGGDWTSDARGELVVWDLAAGRVRAKIDGHRLAVWTIAMAPDGRRFATSCSSGEVKVWDLETLAELKTLQHPSWTRALAYSPDGATLAVGHGDSTVQTWNTSDWQPRSTLAGHSSFVFHLQFAPDGRTLASSGNDGTVRFWKFNEP